MALINFNVAFHDINGKTVMEPAHDKDAFVLDATGNRVPKPLVDENGQPVLKAVFMRELIANLLLAHYQGDENLPFDERVKRGQLARKVNNSDAVNYRNDELLMIQNLAAKSRSTIVLLAIDDLINSPAGE